MEASFGKLDQILKIFYCLTWSRISSTVFSFFIIFLILILIIIIFNFFILILFYFIYDSWFMEDFDWSNILKEWC